METTQETLRIRNNIKETILYIAFELSHRKWKLAFSNGVNIRTVPIDARNLDQLQGEIEKAKQRFGLEGQRRVLSLLSSGSGRILAAPLFIELWG